MHNSVVIPNSIEFINVEATQISPLISKCQIKVCYVGDEPNRNKSIITKEVATKMAPTLRGCPIVGFYNEDKEDFEEHNRVIDISNGKFQIKDTTKPYGFVSLDAKVWFQKFKDDGVEHEYLMTEGYLWTEQYPECQRIFEGNGNNQSMELDEKTLNAEWTKDNNGKYQFFIINEAIMSKLCILGEDVEPCFEGAAITKVQFAFEDDFKQQLFSLMNQMKEILEKGGTPVYTTYAVEIGGALWDAIFGYLADKYPDEKCEWCSQYAIEGVYEEDAQKFAILLDRSTRTYSRLDFSLTEENGFVPSEALIDVTKTFVPSETSQFSAQEVENYEAEYKCKKKDDYKEEKKESEEDEEEKAEEEADKAEEEAEADSESEEESDEEEKEKKKKKYNLEEVTEYTELLEKYNALEAEIAEKQAEFDTKFAEKQTEFENILAEKQAEIDKYSANVEELTETINSLSQFKLDIEHKEKEKMIYETFCMLDNEYKKDVIENIDVYSLDDIEAKLSVICVRNKISLKLDEEPNNGSTTFSLDEIEAEDDSIPAWFRAAREVEKLMNK